MAKQLLHGDDARAHLRDGIAKLVDAVQVTLGPTGRTVLLDKKFGGPVATRDGVSVSKEIELSDVFENLGAQAVRDVASKTHDKCGDGTTTAGILARAIYENGLRHVMTGAEPRALRRGILKGVEAVEKELNSLSRPAGSRTAFEHVAIVAANNDVELGSLIAEAIEKVGPEGVVTVEEGKGRRTELEYAEGMRFDKGYQAPHFLTDPETLDAVLEDAYVLLHEKKISDLKAFLPILKQVAATGRPLLVICEEMEGEPLAVLLVNKMRGVLSACAVKAPGYGDRRKAMMEDMAVLTGGSVVSEELGNSLEKLRVEDLGRARRVVVSKDSTLISGGQGQKKAIGSRVEQVRQLLAQSTSKYDREKLEERLGRLTGGVAILRVGGSTEAEIKERKCRVDNAVHAARAARENGYLPGGGVALMRAIPAVEALRLRGDEALGARILADALSAPLRRIAANSGHSPSLAVAQVRAGKGSIGINAATGRMEDLLKAGILDPTRVVLTALRNAAGLTSLLLTSGTLIADIPNKSRAE